MRASDTTLKLPNTSNPAGATDDVVFTVEQSAPELTAFVSRQADGTILGTRRISFRYTPATKQRNFAKSTMSFSLPKVGTLQSGAFGVLGTVRVNLEVQIPETAGPIDRSQAEGLMASILADDSMSQALFNLEPLN